MSKYSISELVKLNKDGLVSYTNPVNFDHLHTSDLIERAMILIDKSEMGRNLLEEYRFEGKIRIASLLSRPKPYIISVKDGKISIE